MQLSKSFLIFSLTVSLFISGCGKPTFPKEHVIELARKLCKDEYHMDVDSKILGRTLGTYFVLENIFDHQQGLSKDASDRIADILLGITRVSLSTDADIDFFTVVAADKTIPGVETIFVRHITDVKKFLIGVISRDDFFQRLLIDVRYNPGILADRTVTNFFSNLSAGNTRQLLTSYLKNESSSSEMSLAFLRMVLEMKLKDKIHFEILDKKVKTISASKALVYTRVKETYEPKAGYADNEFTFPSGFTYEYFFVVGANNYLAEMQEVYFLDYKDENGNYQKRELPMEYQGYKNILKWPQNDFYLADMSMCEFISSQIAQRVFRKVREWEERGEKDQKALSSRIDHIRGQQAESADGSGKQEDILEINFRFTDSKENDVIGSDLYRLVLEVSRDVIEKYQFHSFKELRLTSSAWRESKAIPLEEFLKPSTIP